MENKKSFGAYICQRRKELGLTQKEFARKLFVTDSAVSKWERGLAYPDITLLESICGVLEISEKELLTSSEDVEGRRAEQLARKYMRLARNYRVIQYILYGLTALGCLIGNLTAQHTLSWFWIVLAGEGMGASLTLLPVLAPENRKGLYSLGGFTGSLLLLLLACCLYTGGSWFFVAAASVLFGMGLLFLPWVLRCLPERFFRYRAAIYIGLETLLMLALLGAGCLYSGGSWYLLAATAVLFGVGLVLGPVILWELPVKGLRATVYILAETVLLVLLLGAGCLYDGGSWFRSAAVWTVFGISVPLLPVVLRQLPLPEPLKRHRAALYLGVETIYLLAALAMELWGRSFPFPAMPVAALCLILPWFWLGALRYLPVGGWFRAGVVLWGTGLWTYLAPWVLDRILMAAGWFSSNPFTLKIQFDLTNWHDPLLTTGNVLILIYLGFFLLGAACMIVGVLRKRKQIS